MAAPAELEDVMPSNASRLLQFAWKHKALLTTAVAAIGKFLADHPNLPAWAKSRLDDIAKRMQKVPTKQGDAAQILGTVGVVRTEANSLAAESDIPASVTASWLKRANDIEHAVRLAEQQSQPLQRRTLAKLKSDTEAVLAEIIETVANGGNGGTQSSSATPS